MKATFKRTLNSKRITEQDFKQLKKAFEAQWQNVDLPLVDKALIEKSGELAEHYALKGCDAFQLVSALAIGSNVFVNSDFVLTEAAKANHLVVWNPAKGEFIEISTKDKNIA